MSVKDDDLELLAHFFPLFKELVLVCCDGFGTSGLAVVANKCRYTYIPFRVLPNLSKSFILV